MNINNCYFRNYHEWNYLGWKEGFNFGYTQKDWNQEIFSKINQVSAGINKGTMVGGANTIELNSSLKPLIEELAFYFEDSRMLANRYKVIFNEGITEEIIFVYNDRVFQKPFLYPKMTQLANGISEISFMDSSIFPEHIIDEYKKKYIGCIRVKNYSWVLQNKT